MIEITENKTDGKALAVEIAGYLSEKRRTNCFLQPEDWKGILEQGKIFRMEFSGGLYLLVEKERQFDLLYFLERNTTPVPLPDVQKPVILEQVSAERTGVSPALEEWEAAGFHRYLRRKRLFLAAKNAGQGSREIIFCGENEQEWMQTLLLESFEPYTSDLPDADTLAADLREKRVIAAGKDGKLLGFLRFGREKKISVLRQIAVLPAARGRGIGVRLVRDWLALERENAAKFQLWVREDNLPALRMYEKLGFQPDGRIAPVMIKEP